VRELERIVFCGGCNGSIQRFWEGEDDINSDLVGA